MYQPETRKESESTRKIALAFAAFLLLSLLLLIIKGMGWI